MADGKFININFPFKDSGKGFFLDLNNEDSRAIKADLMHLLLTRKGERLYMPDFGTNLLKYIFQPNDGITHAEIKDDISQTVKKYLPNLRVDKVNVEHHQTNEYVATIRVDYTISDDVFTATDFVIINV